MGLYFEDFQVGDEFLTPGRTVLEADIVQFAGVSGDYNEVHTNRAMMEKSPFGGPIAHGMLVASIATGLMSRLNLFDGTTIALAEANWRFVGPVRPGDTLRVRMRIREKRETSKPDRGVLRREALVENQQEQVVVRGELVLLIRRRPPDGQAQGR